jgi:hypothetical protein
MLRVNDHAVTFNAVKLGIVGFKVKRKDSLGLRLPIGDVKRLSKTILWN